MKREEPERPAPTPTSEWLAAGLGLVLVGGTIGVLLHEASGEETPPDVTVEVATVTAVSAGHRVEFRAKNRGRRAAAAVRIEGTLRKGTEVVETREATLSYVPAGSESGGGLYFENDPTTLQLTLRATGFEDP